MTGEEFKPKAGQTDYADIHWVPVINCVVKRNGKVLLVHRSSNLKLYPDCWSGVSGFLDDAQSLEDKAREELREELGIESGDIVSIKLGIIFHQEEPKYKKTWIVHPVLVDIVTDKIRLDWEADEYRWFLPAELKSLKLLPGFEKVLSSFQL